jgi:hypothetical protein
MSVNRLLILILLIGAQALSALGLSNGLVMCLGPSGHIAIEHADHEPDCDHGCPNEPENQPEFEGACTTAHACTDIGLTQQLTGRLPTEKRISAPGMALVGALPAPSTFATFERPHPANLTASSRGSPSPPFIRTVVLRL